jgi:uncharacterized coiled-coil protein SlyX
MRATPQTKLATRIRADALRFHSLQQEILQLSYFSKGTVLKRMMKCGHKQCACHRDPAKRHGPYFECTYKVQNKTVNLRLSPKAAPLYRAAGHQYRRLKSLLQRMERLSRQALAHLAQLKETPPH